MLHVLTSLLTVWRSPSRLLLTARSSPRIQAVSSDDIPALWELLVPGTKSHLSSAYTALSYRAACQRLDDAISQIQQQGGTVRGAFVCEDSDSQALRYPALPVGLLKLYSELPKAARVRSYAPAQRFQKDEKGWLWLALLLAEPNPHRTPVVTPVPAPVTPLAVRVTQPAHASARTAHDVLLTSLIQMNVPPQHTYPAPVPVNDLAPLRSDSPVITQPLPLDDKEDKADEQAEQQEAPEAEGVKQRVAALHDDVAAVLDRNARAVTPVPAPSATAPATSDDMSDWLDLDEPKAPRIALSVLLTSDNVAFVGPKGSGKTTALLTAVKHRLGEVIALDPHATPAKWPCRTIGNGRNFDQIRRAFKALQQRMAQRFDEIGNGTRSERYYQKPERRRTMVSDEFRSTVKGVPPIKAVRERGVEVEPAELGAGEYLLERISEGRKVGECVLIACHNDTNEALGLPTGAADMKTCFDYFVYCGGLALERYERRGKVKQTALNELRAMKHPAVVWHTERNTWALLDFDLEPVLPPDDEEKDDDSGDSLILDDAPVTSTPHVQLSPEDLIRKVAALKGITLPVSLDRVSDLGLLPILKIAVSRGLKTLPISRIVFDAERNSRFRTDKLDPVLEQLRCGNG